jgi:hypothetical protein
MKLKNNRKAKNKNIKDNKKSGDQSLVKETTNDRTGSLISDNRGSA